MAVTNDDSMTRASFRGLLRSFTAMAHSVRPLDLLDHRPGIQLRSGPMLPERLLRRLRSDVRIDPEDHRVLPSEDIDAWTVFADHLLDRGDARGELVRIRLELEAGRANEDHYFTQLAATEKTFRESWVRELPDRGQWGVSFLWRDGLVVGIVVLRARPLVKALQRWDALTATSTGQLCGFLKVGRGGGDIVSRLAVAHAARPRSLALWGTDLDEEQATRLTGLPIVEDLVELSVDRQAAGGLRPLLHGLPGLRRLRLTSVSDSHGVARTLVDSPFRTQLELLELRDRLDVRLLMREPWPALRSLSLGAVAIDGPVVLASASLPALRSLRLVHSVMGTQGAIDLAAAPFAPQLSKLDLTSNLLQEDTSRALFRGREWPGLKTLCLKGNPLLDEGLAEFTRASFPQLQRIDLSNTRMTDTGLQIFASNLAAPDLRCLTVSRNLSLTAKGVQNLDTERLRGVEAIDLSHCELGDGLGRVLAMNRWLPGVRVLGLTNNRLFEQTAGALIRMAPQRAWTCLDLGGNPVSSFVDRMVENFPPGQMRRLGLSGTYLQNRGIEALARAAPLEGLTHLDVDQTHFGNAGSEALARSSILSRLHWLSARGNSIGAEARRQLLARWPEALL